MKIDKAERILENFIETRECPANVRAAIRCILDDSTKQFHRAHFAECYLSGVETLTKEDVEVLRQGVA